MVIKAGCKKAVMNKTLASRLLLLQDDNTIDIKHKEKEMRQLVDILQYCLHHARYKSVQDCFAFTGTITLCSKRLVFFFTRGTHYDKILDFDLRPTNFK